MRATSKMCQECWRSSEKHYNTKENNPNYGKIAWNRGIPHSPEAKVKMSKALMGNKYRLGIPHTEKTKEKMRQRLLGNKYALGMKHTEETKEKIRKSSRGSNNYWYGKKLPKEIREKMSANHADVSGSNNPNWQGGINNLPYGWKFNDKLKYQIRKRDDFTCQFPACGKKENSKAHSIHHIDYDKLNNNPKNLISLCNPCHMKTGYNREYWKEYFSQKINIKSKKGEII